MIHKVFSILEAIAHKKACTIDAISESTGIPRSSVHRLLQVLQSEGVVANNRAKRGYVLTSKLLSIGMGGVAERDVLDVAIPLMRHISDITQETVSFSVMCGIRRICIYRVEGKYPVVRDIRFGSNAPLFRGSAGKIIASGLSRNEQEQILERYVKDGIFIADETPVLLNDVEIVRQQGYAVSIGERLKGSASVAVPIADASNNVIAALSISTSEERFTPANRKRHLDLLFDASRWICDRPE